MKNLNHVLILTCSVLLLLGLSSMAAAQTTFTVNSTADANDANPGDGVCDDGSGNCTLRAAITEANAFPGDDTIDLPAGTYTLTIAPDGTPDDNADGDLDITADLTILIR